MDPIWISGVSTLFSVNLQLDNSSVTCCPFRVDTARLRKGGHPDWLANVEKDVERMLAMPNLYRTISKGFIVVKHWPCLRRTRYITRGRLNSFRAPFEICLRI
jgi:hypothetical protein